MEPLKATDTNIYIGQSKNLASRSQSSSRRINPSIYSQILRLLFLFVLLIQNTYATTGVVLQIRNYAIIAIDSLNSVTGPRGIEFSQVCKVLVNKSTKMVIVTAGINEYKFTNFNLSVDLATTIGRTTTVDDARDIADKAILRDVSRIAADVPRHHFKEPPEGVQYVIVGVDPGGQTVVSFTQIDIKGGKAAIHSPPVVREAVNRIGRNFVGNRDVIDSYIASAPDWMYRGQLPKVAQDLVQMEIKAHPDLDGPPISTLYFSSADIHWINPGVCK